MCADLIGWIQFLQWCGRGGSSSPPFWENAAMIHAQRYRLMKGMSQYEDTDSFC